jgi:hypothetical protein
MYVGLTECLDCSMSSIHTFTSDMPFISGRLASVAPCMLLLGPSFDLEYVLFKYWIKIHECVRLSINQETVRAFHLTSSK